MHIFGELIPQYKCHCYHIEINISHLLIHKQDQCHIGVLQLENGLDGHCDTHEQLNLFRLGLECQNLIG